MQILLLALGFILLFMVVTTIAYNLEKSSWNHGRCGICGHKWKLLCENRHERFFVCPHCGNSIRLTYNFDD